LEQVHKELLEVSSQAGMAEVATGVLHNVGNVLNSVNVSAMLISERLSRSKVTHLSNVSTLLSTHSADLGGFLSSHPRGKMLPGFIHTLSERLSAEQSDLLREIAGLTKNIGHIKDIVSVQQSYAKVSGIVESLQASALIEDALQMNATALERHGVKILREYSKTPNVRVDKHKLLQILINVIRNAKDATADNGHREKRVLITVAAGESGRVKIAVSDNGVGIPAENVARIFAHGFTTKNDGHGFGLHTSALAAAEMSGSLTAHSDGPGQGSTFILELPAAAPAFNLENAG
jgi:signal transduction histidine kinase